MRLPGIVRAQAGAYHVIVAGGGFAGATAAKYIKLWGGPAIRVTLINPSAAHTSCIMSNLVLHGSLAMKDIRSDLRALGAYGVDFIKDVVDGIDARQRMVKLRNGGWMSYDRVVLAGGLSFKKVNGLDSTKNPHAWVAGSQTKLLKAQINAMPANGVFVMTIPPAPYRCPPGPYAASVYGGGHFESTGRARQSHRARRKRGYSGGESDLLQSVLDDL
ncbi:MAG: FAD-dependent oxidoreductase [Parvularculaceae bacterium]